MGTIDYKKYLSKNHEAMCSDVKTFKAWEDGNISLEECFNEWWNNNKPTFREKDFRNYLRSLGYIRED